MMEAHLIAKGYRDMTAEEFAVLKDDVAKNGVRVAGWLYEGKILDGRHRYRAATELGKPCPMQDYHGDDPVGFVRSLNEARRHLDPVGVRALRAAAKATATVGRPETIGSAEPINSTNEEAAEGEEVSVSMVKRAKKVLEKAAPEVIKAVESGEVSVSAAAAVADLPQDEQLAAVKAPSTPKKKVDVEALQAEVESLRAERDDMIDRLRETADMLEKEIAANAIFTADEPLKAAMETISERDKTIADLELRMNGLMNEKNAAIRQAKMLSRKK